LIDTIPARAAGFKSISMLHIRLLLGLISHIIRAMLTRVRSIFFLIYAFAGFVCAVIIAAVMMVFFRDKQAFLQAYGRFCLNYIFIPASGVKVVTHGLADLPRHKALIFVCNHQSNADAPILIANLPVRVVFMAKRELFSIPLLGWYMRAAGHIQIERSKIRSALTAIEQMADVLRNGESVFVFPEGTRSHDGSLGIFKRGGMIAAQMTGAAIVPVALSGSYKIMRRGSLLIRPATVKLSVGEPIYIKDEKEIDEKLKQTRDAIARML